MSHVLDSVVGNPPPLRDTDDLNAVAGKGFVSFGNGHGSRAVAALGRLTL